MTDSIVKLREETGAGVMDCKKALDDANGDYEKARAFIFERGGDKATKRQERKTGSGILEAYIHSGRIGVLLEIRCETDFVAHNETFKALGHDIAMHIVSMDPATVDELLAQPFVRDESVTIQDLVTRAIAKTGENIKIERFCRYEI
ncbi:MAG: translation elongation factor Ts [Candidatus Paceibacterota bacterium]|jgi:elongation factor Ts